MPPSSALPDFTGAFVDEGYLHIISLLGRGGSAKVYKAVDTTSPSDDPAFFAVKCMMNGPRGSMQSALLNNEFRMHDTVADHPGVLSFHSVFVEGDYIFAVFDLCAADMLTCVVDRQLYVGNPALVKQAFVELLDVVDDCHQESIYHRDIKPQNILCNSEGTDIRLADFGAATPNAESHSSNCGTTGYMSPECLDTARTTYSSRGADCWSLAITLVVLATGHVPWNVADTSDRNYAAFRADPANFLQRLLSLTHEANDIFRWCFHVDPARRPSIPQLRAAVLATPCFSVADVPAVLRAIIPTPAHSCVTSTSSATSSDITSAPSTTPSSSTGTTSSAGPSTPHDSGIEPPIAIVDLLDAANIGLAALYPEPLKPTKLYGRFIPAPLPSHLKSAPEFRFLDLKRRGVANRKRFADTQRRTF
ncbi:kinase-like domain-containing protein [Mycena rosella]|uniref:Kinase-like domain-containing protein n=1 Tax=Mycena rosella TaxID=1033263 RepID=A0AAD7GBK4_MYCRO|nr:kinase-like domain-containing protein [Mycena rosella]